MKVKLPGWLYLLLLLDAASVVLLFGARFGGWALPEWLTLEWLERLAPLAPTLTMVAWGIWEFKPGGVWDQYEARQKKAREEAAQKKQAQEAAMQKRQKL